jgi:hypothetical protein
MLYTLTIISHFILNFLSLLLMIIYFNIDEYDGDRDGLNEDFCFNEGNKDHVYEWIDNDSYGLNVIDMIKRDYLVITPLNIGLLKK